MQCTYCDKPKTQVVFVYVCDDAVCVAKARGEHSAPANHAKTTFG